MKTIKLPASKIMLNEGQIDGLPANPRQWKGADVDRIATSLRETPELFEMRPCIVTPFGDGYVILAGSLRYSGARKNGDKQIPCIIFEGGVEKMKEIVIKDNGTWGAWDFDALANEWDAARLLEWGVPAWTTSAEEEAEELEKSKEMGDVPFAEQLREEHNYICLYFNDEVDWLQAQTLFGIRAVRCPSTKKDGKGSTKFGVGRVINGAKAIDKLLGK